MEIWEFAHRKIGVMGLGAEMAFLLSLSHGKEVGGGGRRIAMDVDMCVEECVLRERESSGMLTLLID